MRLVRHAMVRRKAVDKKQMQEKLMVADEEHSSLNSCEHPYTLITMNVALISKNKTSQHSTLRYVAYDTYPQLQVAAIQTHVKTTSSA